MEMNEKRRRWKEGVKENKDGKKGKRDKDGKKKGLYYRDKDGKNDEKRFIERKKRKQRKKRKDKERRRVNFVV